jgi:hypothetical protein
MSKSLILWPLAVRAGVCIMAVSPTPWLSKKADLPRYSPRSALDISGGPTTRMRQCSILSPAQISDVRRQCISGLTIYDRNEAADLVGLSPSHAHELHAGGATAIWYAGRTISFASGGEVRIIGASCSSRSEDYGGCNFGHIGYFAPAPCHLRSVRSLSTWMPPCGCQ